LGIGSSCYRCVNISLVCDVKTRPSEVPSKIDETKTIYIRLG